MKKNGFSIIEAVVAVALIVITFLLVTPLIKSMGMFNSRIQKQSEIDTEFSVTTKFIKDKVKSARNNQDLSDYPNDPDYAAVFSEYKSKPKNLFKSKFSVDSEDNGPLLFLEIPVVSSDSNEYDSKFVFFLFDSDDKELKYRESDTFDAAARDDPDNYTFSGYGWVTLMENVQEANFQFTEGIVIFYIDLDVGEFEGKLKDKIKDSVVTRIDFEI
ncbi:type II secretion system protein [uncultured Ilyobacter sp.]|uniref:type II secretion system protein n=1 Tax=uncultured Ilyobacter sp. TaxID=544433 RepID=UPI0029BFCE59|nr:type II secretion system protein [uncultured Ilyobacter sp.]